jgi:RNA polymerase sigma factor (sigma-70 family)
MARIPEADKFLLDQILQGRQDIWSQLVNRYQGRLLTFARTRLPQRADCEDIVQDTFIAFLKGIQTFRQDCSLETYLFSLLRRKIIDNYRRRGSSRISLIQDVYQADAEDGSSDALDGFAASSPSVSWYMRRNEQVELQRQALTDAMTQVVRGFKESLDFTNLQIVDLVFYCHLSNSDAARALNVPANRIGVTKHRCLNQIRQWVRDSGIPMDDPAEGLEDLLSEIWQQQRLSCPKRSTIGAYLLNTLDTNWHAYVDFHVNQLGCHFCRANLHDLQQQNTEHTHPKSLHTRIMQSTVGFLNKA